MRSWIATAVLALAITSMAGEASAAAAHQCKDAKGKYIKCPAPTKTAPAKASTSSSPMAAVALGGAAPSGATAKCKDGSYSTSKTHSGACSHHGGVANWL
jgi:hypothetical protein